MLFWMGVPVITKQGVNFLSRVGETIANNSGNKSFIAENDEEYISLALQLTKDIPMLNKLRMGRREKTLNSPLFNAKVFAADFERLLFEINDRDTNLVKKQMNDFKVDGNFHIGKDQLNKINNLFSAFMISDFETLNIIKKTYIDHKYMLDPHSAIGYGAVQKAVEQKIISNDSPIISLACAHPAKFPAVIEKSIGILPEFPVHLDHIINQKEN
mgnify:CR=1 FL=1